MDPLWRAQPLQFPALREDRSRPHGKSSVCMQKTWKAKTTSLFEICRTYRVFDRDAQSRCGLVRSNYFED